MVRMESDGKVRVSIGDPSSGQGYETVIAQIVADELGLTPADVAVARGFDSATTPWLYLSGNYSNKFSVTDTGAIVGEIEPRTPKPAALAPRLGGAAPAARRRAGELGVDIAKVEGTGPEGTITLGDVEKAAGHDAAGRAQPLRGVRRAMAGNMARSHAAVVPATVTEEADIGGWRAAMT